MAYSDRIDELKKALSNYSENEEKLMALYDSAIKNAESAYETGVKRLDEQYRRNRNDAVTDTARDERNAFNILASRGLGFSGEAAQTKLNSNILLSNRLGDLAADKNEKAENLAQSLSDTKADILHQRFKEQSDINERRNALLSDIAAIESESEQKKAELQAEKEMHQAELDAKYGNTIQNDNPESEGVTEGGDTVNDFTPNTTPKELAKLMVQNVTDGESLINTDEHIYLINKYLLDIQDNYQMDDDYMDQLVFMLKAHGYEDIGRSAARVMVITREAEAYYEDRYLQRFNEFIPKTLDRKEANRYAIALAKRDLMDHLYSRTENEQEFRKCCAEMGLENALVETYAENKGWETAENEKSTASKGGRKQNHKNLIK